jgi:cell division septum initiation protein DivIVA
MDVHARIADLRQTVVAARSMPLSASAVVNRGEMLGKIDEISETLGSALADAERVLAERDAVIEAARVEADRIVADAHAEREKITSDTDILRVARREAQRLVDKAQAEAAALRREIDDYVDAKLANFEITLQRTSEAVTRGRERLAGRSALGISSDEVDKIKLPAHLDG